MSDTRDTARDLFDAALECRECGGRIIRTEMNFQIMTGGFLPRATIVCVNGCRVRVELQDLFYD
jgi:hypothetical protein